MEAETDGILQETTLRRAIEFERIGNRAVHRAQEENRQMGIPNVYAMPDGTLYYQLPDGTVTMKNPFSASGEDLPASEKDA